MSEAETKPAETPAALRQRRRRQRLQELKASTVDVLLTEEQGKRLQTLLTAGYAPDKSSVLAKSLDEAFEREIKPRSSTKAKK
jgi:hypothetical protein